MISKTEVDCDHCKNKFLKSISEMKRYPDRRNFCRRDCYFSDKARKSATCSHCDKEYIPQHLKIYKTNFCSKECQLAFTVRRNDFTGKQIGRCVVVGKDAENTHKDKYWLVKCKCKEVFSVRYIDIRKGNVYECPNCVFRRSQYYIGGKKFGRLSVQDKWQWMVSPANGKRFRYWWCVCECGNELWINAQSILRAHTVSCGCQMQKNCSRYVNETLYPIKHGFSGKNRTEIYCRWTLLVAKCYNSKNQSFHHFGAKGFTVCDNWRNNYLSFHQWMESQGFNPGLSVEIKEGKTEFSPSNCFLCPVREHANRMRNETIKARGIEYRNEIHSLKKWSGILGIGYLTLRKRWDSCKDMKQCVEGEWKDGSGCHMRRDDVSDSEIKRLYEEGKTTAEIEKILGTTSVKYRLSKMDVKMRPAKRRPSLI